MNQDTRLTALSSIGERSLPKELSNFTNVALRSRDEGLVYYLNLIHRRKWLVLSVVVIATTSVALYAFSLPSIYQAEVTLRFEPKQSVFRQDTNSRAAFYSFENYEYANTQIKLLNNPQFAAPRDPPIKPSPRSGLPSATSD